MKKIITLLFVASLSVMLAVGQNHTGNITSDETWSGTDTITGSVTVLDGVTLTIAAGTVIKMGYGAMLEIRGRLHANGIEPSPVIFTANTGTPTKGYWHSIYFNGADSASWMKSCIVEYGGSSSANIYIHNSADNVEIEDCIVRKSEFSGIYVNDYNANPSHAFIHNTEVYDNETYGISLSGGYSEATIYNCNIHDNGSYPLRVWANGIKYIGNDMNYSNNNPNAVYVDGSNVYTGTWPINEGLPYILGGYTRVMNENTLTIEPGCEIRFGQQVQLEIQGALIADGEPGSKIIFTSSQATPTPGYWTNINFNSADAGTILDNCIVSYGGYNNNDNIRIHNCGTNVTITDSEISHSGSSGIFINDYNASPTYLTINGSTVSNNGIYGIRCDGGYSGLTIYDCTLENNGSYPIYTWAAQVYNITGNMQFAGNNPDAILVLGSDVYTGTWLDFGVPYVINGYTRIVDANTLTLSPGCELRFNSAIQMEVQGTLIADGEPGNKITFTSNQSTPTPGHWTNIHFNGADAGTILDNCIVSYGGYNNNDNIRMHNCGTNVTITNSEICYSGSSGLYINDYNANPSYLTISGSVISNNGGYGIRCDGGYSGLTIYDCTLENNGIYPIYTWAQQVCNITGNMQFSGNGPDAILVLGSSIYTGTWLNHGVPYVINAYSQVVDANVLTISPGCELRFNSAIQMEVQGALIADGEPGNKITFTSNQTSPTPGYWTNIHFNGADAGTVIDNCIVSYGGYNGNDNIRMHNCGTNVTITDSEIIHSGSSGIMVYDYNSNSSYLTISGSVISNNGGYGIRCDGGYSGLTIYDCTLENNGIYPIYTWAQQVCNITGNMQFSGNNPDAILVLGSNIYTGTWLNHNVPYVISAYSLVADANVLTIDPGCELRFNSTVQFEVQGALIADGEPGNKITFTSNQATPTPGHWTNIYFNGADAGTVMDNCIVSYGGYNNNDNIRIHNCGTNVTITNSEISYSGSSGIFLYDYNSNSSYLTISGSTISNNGGYGIRCDGGYSGLTIYDCTFENNGSYPIYTWSQQVCNITGNMQFTGNNPDAILVLGSNIYTGTWLNHNVPYVINAYSLVADANVLTIDPGCELRFNSTVQFEVQGALIANGEPGNKITFTSSQSTPSAGHWTNIYFNGADAGTVMDNCIVSYGGYNNYENIRLHNCGTNVTITASEISHSGSSGIFLYDYNTNSSYLTISGSIISDNGSYGIRCDGGYSGLTIYDCTLENNGSYPVRTWASFVKNITGAMQISGNSPDAIYVDGTNIYTGTWLNHNVPYRIGSYSTLVDANTLTINPGCEIQFTGSTQFEVQGTLIAQGSKDPKDRITFTSSQAAPAPGDWGRLYFNLADAGCILEDCDILYGGSVSGNVYIRGSADHIAITGCNVKYSSSSGIYINDQNTTQTHLDVFGCDISNNGAYGIISYSSGNHTIDNCALTNNNIGFYSNWNTHYFLHNNLVAGNSSHGIQLAGSSGIVFGGDLTQWNDIHSNGGYNIYNGSYNVQAPYVYWGSTNADSIAAWIFDKDDNSALGKVYYTPWTNAAHDSLFPQSFFDIHLKVFLEGPFSGGTMSNTLSGLPEFPHTQPYNMAPWNYTGTEQVNTLPSGNIVDWVLVEMRDAPDAASATGATIVQRRAGFLLNNGSVVSLDGVSPLVLMHEIQNNLFIVIRHRNHLDVMTSTAVNLTETTYIYDFTTGSDKVYGGALGYKEMEPGYWGMIGGDGDASGSIGTPDKVDVWAVQAGGSGYLNGDFNLNGEVNNGDKIELWAPNAGLGTQVPDSEGYSSQVPE